MKKKAQNTDFSKKGLRPYPTTSAAFYASGHPFTSPQLDQGSPAIEGPVLSTCGHKLVMPHGTALGAQNRDRARRTAGNDGPGNYRNIGKLSELNAGGIATLREITAFFDGSTLNWGT